MTRKKFVFDFEEGDGKNKHLLGGKGANLCEMTQIGLPVPPGFVISTEACLKYFDENKLPKGLMEEVRTHMEALEKRPAKDSVPSPLPCWSRSVPVRPSPCRV